MDLYIVRHSVDYEGDAIWFISEDKQEALAKAEYYLAMRRQDKATSDESIQVLKCKEARLSKPAKYAFEDMDLVFSERVS